VTESNIHTTNDWAAIALAAGSGSRMSSKLPKVLHQIAGIPIICHVLDALDQVDINKVILVTNPENNNMLSEIKPEIPCVIQNTPLGTGNAVSVAYEIVSSFKNTIIINGDLPLITKETIQNLMKQHSDSNNTITLASTIIDNPQGYGRLKKENETVTEIVEQSELSEENEKLSEVNVGIYAVKTEWLNDALASLKPHDNGEYFFTDIIDIATRQKIAIHTYELNDPNEAVQVNNRIELANAEQIMQNNIREQIMLNGTTMVDPRSTFIDKNVVIGQDTILEPGVHLSGNTEIGFGCHIGPNANIVNTKIGDNVKIGASTIEMSVIGNNVSIGPYCHLREGSKIADEVNLGNYVEIKHSTIGRHTKIGHFTYIGDSIVGELVNIGAGTITANFDGKEKHQTVIEDGSFIGVNSVLIAPVRVGRKSKTGAGTIVTKDVPPESLVVGAPGRIRSGKGE
tara:strand:- start:14473 stop:15840 length:1368 start_codon:yes stop_codon:yes gene_type:complete